MPEGYPYTEEEKAFIVANYRNGMTAEQVAKHLGKTANNIKKWACHHRRKGLEIKSKCAKTGERRTQYVKSRNCDVVREKQADGSWKFIEYTNHRAVKHPGRPVGYERPARSGAIFRKTENGWEYIKKAKSERKPAFNVYNIGDVVTRMNKGKERQFVKTELGWKMIPLPSKPRVQKKTVKKHKPVKLERINPNKRSYQVDRNPDKVKVPVTEGGQWVRLDAKTLVYRKNAS